MSNVNATLKIRSDWADDLNETFSNTSKRCVLSFVCMYFSMDSLESFVEFVEKNKDLIK